MTAAALQRWSQLHTWSSLVCTIFMIVICLTGLPLIFSGEIDRWSDAGPAYGRVAKNTPKADVDSIVARAHQAFPQELIRYVYWPDSRPAVVVSLTPSDDADDALEHSVTFDAYTGRERNRETAQRVQFMDVMRHLHEDLFVGLLGESLLAVMAGSFVLALVSGAVLYSPFMRHVSFGVLRAAPGTRLAWLDLHNVLSAVVLSWMAVLGITGIINELATPLLGHWLDTEVTGTWTTEIDEALPTRLSSLQATLAEVKRRLPDRAIDIVYFPTHHFGSPRHYFIWTQGQTPLSSKLDVPVLADASTGRITAIEQLPWYLTILELARPLHFGDYGGLPLKILWAMFDVLTLTVLLSGVKLWVSRGRLLSRRHSRCRLRSRADRVMQRRSSVRVWRDPLVMALVTGLGLMTALLGRGAWWGVSWSCLAWILGWRVRYRLGLLKNALGAPAGGRSSR